MSVEIPKSPIQKLDGDDGQAKSSQLFIKRDDLIHPLQSGNKIYKLSENMRLALAQGCRTLVSFGGGYSNHLHALALTGNQLGFDTVGFIRGHYQDQLTPTLKDCVAAGMQLRFLNRPQWAQRNDSKFLHVISKQYPDSWVIPEGGDNLAGFIGARTLGKHIREQMANRCGGLINVFLACGTGTTLAGVVAELPSCFSVHGISVLKGQDTITANVNRRLEDSNVFSSCSWQVHTQWHFGGYAKCPPELSLFINKFENNYSIQLDPVYTAKAMCAASEMIDRRCFHPDDAVLFIHTGGLQGRRGYALD